MRRRLFGICLLFATIGAAPFPPTLLGHPPTPAPVYCLAKYTCTGADNPLTVVQTVLLSVRANANALGALYAPNAVILDDAFWPHRWDGPNAGTAWVSAIDNWRRHLNATDFQVLSPGFREYQVTPTNIHMIVAATYSMTVDNKVYQEGGTFSFILTHSDNQWKVYGQSWSAQNGFVHGPERLMTL